MKFYQIILAVGLAGLFGSCIYFETGLNVVNSQSIPAKEVTLDSIRLAPHLAANSLYSDTTVHNRLLTPLEKSLKKMFGQIDRISENQSDTAWASLVKSWNSFRINHTGADGLPVLRATNTENTDPGSPLLNRDWANVNIRLLKLSEEVRFGDVLEKMLYEPKVPVFTSEMLKSIIYTRVDDQIYVNIFGNSSMTYQHTTGGKVKIWQETEFPNSNEVLIKIDCDDIRFMDIYIRIPEWAKHPTVTHGNVKYVPYAGQYCEVSRKWKRGDIIVVNLDR